MSTTHRHLGDRLHHSRAGAPSSDASVEALDMKLENEIIPVSDVDRAKQFYERLGWGLDDDAAPLDGLRIVQFTPPGSGASITLGITTAAPGSTEGGAARLRHRSCPRRTCQTCHRRERRVARPAIPSRGTA